MKLITLNTWGGRVGKKLKDFVEKSSHVDIWLFQEVYNSDKPEETIVVPGYVPDFSLNKNLCDSLGSHHNHFCQVLKGIYGLTAFFRPEIEIIEKGEVLVAVGNWDTDDSHNRDHDRKLQWFKIKLNEKVLLLINTHLTHRPEGKRDDDKRLKQSDVIANFIKMFDGPKILAGDFNLLPDTESIKMLEQAGMRNLIKECNILSTRTELYKKELRFADYIFVSPEIKVSDFKVLPDVVSDHSPLYLDFDI